MQLTGWHNGNEMRKAICVDTQIQLSGPTVHSLYCGLSHKHFTSRLFTHFNAQHPKLAIICYLLWYYFGTSYKNDI